MKEKAIVVVSGGMDSVTLLWDVVKSETYDVEGFSVNYGQRHSKELEFAKKNCALLGVKHNLIDLSSVGKQLLKGSALTSDIDVPEGHYSDDNMRITVVPNRNMILLSLAVGYCESINGKKVFLGSHQGDRAQYPDCRAEFTEAVSKAAKLGTYNEVEIISKYNNLMKWDIVKIGHDLGVPYELTWSCYKGVDRPDLKCGTCTERTEAFAKNNLKDPLLTNEEWEDAVKFLKAVS